MPDVATITAVLAGLKTASEIAKTLGQSDLNLEKAELKFKLAELYEALALARMSATSLTEELQEKDREIARLLEAVALKDEVVKRGDAYFKKGPDGKAVDDPFCVNCWDAKKKLVHIHRMHATKGPDVLVCPQCKTGVVWHSINWP